jgi:hypothetical protein
MKSKTNFAAQAGLNDETRIQEMVKAFEDARAPDEA